ncbi:MAG: hypothetical protein H0X16_09945 [Chloroflexi bacterium]|nr:hypothetical protein [Chloroflexota bacterium]
MTFPRRSLPARPAAVLLAVATLLAPLPAELGGPSVAEAATTSVTTGDGLRLGLTSGISTSANGAVASIATGSRTLPKLSTRGGFSARLVGATPNLLRNPGFQGTSSGGVPSSWSLMSGSSRPVLLTSFGHSSTRSLRIKLVSATSGTFRQDVSIRPNTNYVFGAWMRTDNVAPTSTGVGNLATSNREDTPVQIRVDQLSSTGRIVASSFALSYANDSPWSRQSVGFKTRSDAVRVRVTGYADPGAGYVWFDDLWLRQLFSDTTTAVGGSISKSGATITQSGSMGNGLSLRANYTAKANHILVKGTVTSSSERAFRVTYSLPVNATGGGWRWWNYARSSQPITAGVLYGQQRGTEPIDSSRYPYAVINDASSALAIGTPLSEPRLSRFRYGSSGLTVSFDLGVSPAAGGKADFTFVIYRADPAWGFRSATEKFYRIEPLSFCKAATTAGVCGARWTQPSREGAWFLGAVDESALDPGDPATTPNEARTVWGLGVHLNPTDIAWDIAHDLYSAVYTHHWGFFMPCPDGGTSCVPTYEQAVARLRDMAANSPNERLRDQATATLNSGLRDQNGRLRFDVHNLWGTRWYDNPDPDISSTGMDWNRAIDKHQVQPALASGANALYMDSSAGMRTWGVAMNYDRDDWRVADESLSFSYDTGAVTQINFLNMYPQFKRIAALLHQRGAINAVDFNADESVPMGYFGADAIDSFMFENGLPERGGALTGLGLSADSFAMQKRSMAFQRPVSSLDPKIGDVCSDGEVIDAGRRIEQSLFYGIFAGPNKEEPHPWWNCTGLRSKYARYTPIFLELQAAGWEPVTYAKSSRSDVWVERFGTSGNNDLFLTLRNETSISRTVTLTIDLRKSVASGTPITARERVLDQARGVTRLNTSKISVSVSVPARTTRVIDITIGS